MVEFVNESDGRFGINCIDDHLVITTVDEDGNIIEHTFPLDTAISICRAIIYHTCMIGDGKNILEIVNRIISVDRPIFNTSDVMH